MRLFFLDRQEDETGISGTGRVAEGVEFSDGRCVMRWLTEYRSVAVYDSLEDLEEIHGHDGRTEIVIPEKSIETYTDSVLGSLCITTRIPFSELVAARDPEGVLVEVANRVGRQLLESWKEQT